MATTLWPKSVTRFLEVESVWAVVDGFEDQMHDLLDHFVPDTGNAEFAHFSVRLWNELLPDWSKAKLFGFHLLDDLADRCERKAIQRFSIRARCHIAGLGFDALVGDDVQIFLIHQSIQIVIDPLSIAIQVL